MAFQANLELLPNIAKITISGELDASVAPAFRERIEEAAEASPKRLVLVMNDLEYMSSAGLRVLVFAKQKMGAGIDIYVVGAQPQVVEPIRQTGFHHSVVMLDSYDAERIENV
ncbi:MAG: anti-sigma factor antagonist [Chloroflexota bacterium]|jgi:anti-anti-sigma factor|nr:MAG: anti-anti-sigma factor [Chloroflexota bacterium]